MSRKYELVESDKAGLFRIRALKDFGKVKEGDLGGYVEGEHNLSHEGDCWIYDNATVTGKALVKDSAVVKNEANTYGSVVISGNAIVTDKVCVFENAKIRDSARITYGSTVRGNAIVSGRANVTDFADVSEDARVTDDAYVSCDARIFGRALVCGFAKISGDAKIAGDACVGDTTSVYGNARVIGKVFIKGEVNIGYGANIKGQNDFAVVGPIAKLGLYLTGYMNGGEVHFNDGKFTGNKKVMLEYARLNNTRYPAHEPHYEAATTCITQLLTTGR